MKTRPRAPKLTITLEDGAAYEATREDELAAAWRLRKSGAAEGHRIERIGGRVVCSCGDYQYRKQGTDEPCKHGRAAAAVGLV